MSREQRIAQSQQDGTFGTIRDKYNLENKDSGVTMNKFGNIAKVNPLQATAPMDPDTPGGASALARSRMMNRPVGNALTEKRGFGSPQTIQGAAPAQAPASQAISPQAANRAGLEDRSAGLKLLREMSQTPLQIVNTPPTWDENGFDTLTGKYGTGVGGIKDPKKEGTVGGRPFSEVMRGIANKQVNTGTWREGDRLPNTDFNDGADTYDTTTRAGLMSQSQAKTAAEEARQKILSRQRIAAKSK
jgi:hypothetical protein